MQQGAPLDLSGEVSKVQLQPRLRGAFVFLGFATGDESGQCLSFEFGGSRRIDLPSAYWPTWHPSSPSSNRSLPVPCVATERRSTCLRTPASSFTTARAAASVLGRSQAIAACSVRTAVWPVRRSRRAPAVSRITPRGPKSGKRPADHLPTSRS